MEKKKHKIQGLVAKSWRMEALVRFSNILGEQTKEVLDFLSDMPPKEKETCLESRVKITRGNQVGLLHLRNVVSLEDPKSSNPYQRL